MITTPQGFDLQGQEPLEGKTVQQDATARIAITTATKYDGLSVYQVDTKKVHQWQGTPSAGAWVELVLDGFPTSNFINTSAGVGDAGKPIILDAAGKIDTSMLSASDLSLYYLLDGTRPLTGVMDAGANKLTNIGVGSLSGDAVAYQQLSGYLPIGGTAADSSLLGTQNSAYYRNASNINAGTIADTYLPATITSNITGNAATATSAAAWTNSINITLSGQITSPPTPIDGSGNVTIFTSLSGAGTHGSWQTPTYNTGYQAFSSIPLRFRLLQSGQLQINGNIQETGAGVGSAVAFTLPAGFRPAVTQEIDAMDSQGGGSTDGVTIGITGTFTLKDTGPLVAGIVLSFNDIVPMD